MIFKEKVDESKNKLYISLKNKQYKRRFNRIIFRDQQLVQKHHTF